MQMNNQITTHLYVNNALKKGGEECIAEWRADETAMIWVDVVVNNVEQTKQLLTSLECHPLGIQDALRDRHPPKIESFEKHLLIIYRGIASVKDPLEFEHQDLTFFVFERCLITVRNGASLGVQGAQETILHRGLNSSTLHLALKIIRLSADIYVHQILEFESTVSDCEDAILGNEGETVMHQLVGYRSVLQKLKRLFSYHLNITKTLLNSGFVSKMEHSDNRHEIIDLHDRFERLSSMTQMHYDICGDLLDGFMSLSAHRLNNNMRVLTVVTTIFVPLSFLVGFYGMNFEYMPELHYRYAYFIFIGFLGLVAGALIIWFKRRKWL